MNSTRNDGSSRRYRILSNGTIHAVIQALLSYKKLLVGIAGGDLEVAYGSIDAFRSVSPSYRGSLAMDDYLRGVRLRAYLIWEREGSPERRKSSIGSGQSAKSQMVKMRQV
jgi:Protein of unknown function (DUF2934)